MSTSSPASTVACSNVDIAPTAPVVTVTFSAEMDMELCARVGCSRWYIDAIEWRSASNPAFGMYPWSDLISTASCVAFTAVAGAGKSREDGGG